MDHTISKSVNKVDNGEKLRGFASYSADLGFEGMLFAKTLRSTKARARILSIDTKDVPEGYFIVDKNDVPGQNRVKVILNDQPFFAEDCVNYIGEPILLVVGRSKQTIDEIISRIDVQYEEINPIFTLEEAKDKSIMPIYGVDNCFAKFQIAKGDVDKAFAKAEQIIEDEYNTGYQEHIYLEPQGIIGTYENGKVSVYGSIQCPYYVKNALIQAFAWEGERIRVVQNTLGGAFGGKEEYPSLIAGHVAFAAVKTGKPVQLIFDRMEDIEATTKRHPALIKFRTALDKNKNIIGMDIDIVLNGGAYSGLSSVVLQRTIFAVPGVYNIPNILVK